jgi:hypothetical protein
MRQAFLPIAALLCVGAADAVPVAAGGSPSAADRAAVSALETKLIAGINADGALKTISGIAQLGLPEQAIDDLKKIDTMCGKITFAERVETKSVGSFYISDSIVAVHTGCLMKWDLTFAKEKGVWTLRHFNFNTPDRGW